MDLYFHNNNFTYGSYFLQNAECDEGKICQPEQLACNTDICIEAGAASCIRKNSRYAEGFQYNANINTVE